MATASARSPAASSVRASPNAALTIVWSTRHTRAYRRIAASRSPASSHGRGQGQPGRRLARQRPSRRRRTPSRRRRPGPRPARSARHTSPAASRPDRSRCRPASSAASRPRPASTRARTSAQATPPHWTPATTPVWTPYRPHRHRPGWPGSRRPGRSGRPAGTGSAAATVGPSTAPASAPAPNVRRSGVNWADGAWPGQPVSRAQHLAQHAGAPARPARPPRRSGRPGRVSVARSSSRWYDSCSASSGTSPGWGRLAAYRRGEPAEVEAQHGQGAPDRIDVGGDRRALALQLRCLVARRAPQRRGMVVHASHRAEVDELELLLGVDHVVRLEVAEQQATIVQVAQGGQDLDAVRQYLIAAAAGARCRQRPTWDSTRSLSDRPPTYSITM